MANEERSGPQAGSMKPAGAYRVYAAGGLFTQDELAMNVALKEAIWRQSGGRYVLVLPQSKEPEEMEDGGAALCIRNLDLLHVFMADFVLARFEGQELDAGVVAEFMMAKWLGKPAVILRSDSRRLAGQDLDDPYNLMVRYWPRTVQVHLHSLMGYLREYLAARAEGDGADAVESDLAAELAAVRRGTEAMAGEIIGALDRVREMPSPYPQAARRQVYALARLAPGSGFADLLGEADLAAILESLEGRGTL